MPAAPDCKTITAMRAGCDVANCRSGVVVVKKLTASGRSAVGRPEMMVAKLDR